MTEHAELWQNSMVDPFRERLLGSGDALPDVVRGCAAPLRDEPALDPALVNRLADDVVLPADIRPKHPLLERVVRVGLAHIDGTFVGLHPKYGTGFYAQERHDSFPPTIISTVDALTLWGNIARAEALFAYWLDNFVRPDGTIDYYGPSLSEYGMLLTSARRMMERSASNKWLEHNRDAFGRLAALLQSLLHKDGDVRLLVGVPEADEMTQTATYFHNNAWVVRGLRDWAHVVQQSKGDNEEIKALRADAEALLARLKEAMDDVWPADEADWWLRPTVEEAERPERITGTRLASYTNYRYWPELLSSGVLPRRWAERIVSARLNSGGQFCGTTRFQDHLDDWPLAEYLDGLRMLGMDEDYRICLWGHVFYHQAEGHLTAYEQVTLPPGRKRADYCLPCQLVAVRAARHLPRQT